MSVLSDYPKTQDIRTADSTQLPPPSCVFTKFRAVAMNTNERKQKMTGLSLSPRPGKWGRTGGGGSQPGNDGILMFVVRTGQSCDVTDMSIARLSTS